MQARFTDSADTVEGRYQHRAVDRERGAARLPDDGEVRTARSLLLSSPRLGLIARVDVLEGVGRDVRVVAAYDLTPSPLVDSPKYPRCLLVGICMPDEINALAARSVTLVRRLLPCDPAPAVVCHRGGRTVGRAIRPGRGHPLPAVGSQIV